MEKQHFHCAERLLVTEMIIHSFSAAFYLTLSLNGIMLSPSDFLSIPTFPLQFEMDDQNGRSSDETHFL